MTSKSNRLSRMAKWADIAWCMALAAELAGDTWNAARWELEARLMAARRDQLARHHSKN